MLPCGRQLLNQVKGVLTISRKYIQDSHRPPYQSVSFQITRNYTVYHPNHSSYVKCPTYFLPHLLYRPLPHLRLLVSPGQRTCISTSSSKQKEDAPGKKESIITPEITVIDGDKVLKMKLDEAERLAKRRDLKLVMIEDSTMRRGSNVYKLMTGKEYFEEQMKAKKNKKTSGPGSKDEKVLAIGGKISAHDLEIKLRNLTKWLSKGHQTKVTINAKKATTSDMENIFTIIEKEVKEFNGRILQRHQKADDIRFYVAPVKEKKNPPKSEATEKNEPGQSDHNNK